MKDIPYGGNIAQLMGFFVAPEKRIKLGQRREKGRVGCKQELTVVSMEGDWNLWPRIGLAMTSIGSDTSPAGREGLERSQDMVRGGCH